MPLALLAALAGSLVLHTAALLLPDVDLAPAAEPEPLVAELRPPPAPLPPISPIPPVAKPAEPALPKARPRPARPAAVAAPPAAVAAAPAIEVPPPVPAPAAEEKVPAPPALVQPAEPQLPARGFIRYAVYRGDQGFQVGRAEHRWEFVDGRYRLTATTETTGLAALFKPIVMELESRGRLASFGLQPERFVTRRNGGETKENAEFDWETKQVTLQRDGSRHSVRDGAQDLLSFHYQLAFVGSLGAGTAMGVATGRKFERYQFDALGEENVDTPAGAFRTLHLKVQTDSTTELWLALDRRLLPVKIRYTDRKGDSFEQVATELGT